MSKKCKTSIYILICLIAIVFIMIIIKVVFFSGIFSPIIHLKGSNNIKIEVGGRYLDEGAYGSFQFKDISDSITVKSNVNTNKIGSYEVIYSYQDNCTKKRKVEVVDTTPPLINLLGNQNMVCFQGSKYIESGYTSSDNNDGDISANVKVITNLDTNTIGKYEVKYEVSDSFGNITNVIRNVSIVNDPTKQLLRYNYDSYDNKAEEWWFKKSVDHKRNEGAKKADYLKKLDAYYLGDDNKTIYLTFDEGGNDITYIKEIANILNELDVKATYFLTRNYILSNERFINELVDSGNVIGNHTHHHYDMPSYATESNINIFVKEISETQKAYTQVTGKEMAKIFRFPKGNSSERALKIVQDLGYRSYFWSHAYNDYGEEISKEMAYNSLVDHAHNGAIYLIHPSNRGNYLAMSDFIKEMKEQGYNFGILK
ncbi:MAG: DUF5011 domain-containing protein [Erysipelotrichaceae bacterium]